MNTTTKTFARRDSATALLRKAGVNKVDYNKYITMLNGEYAVTMNGKAPVASADVEKETVEQGDAAANEAELEGAASLGERLARNFVPGAAPKVKAPKAKAPKAQKVSVASRARELILAGKDNVEVFAILQKELGLGENKKHYPSWYRSQLKRDGKLV